MTTVRRVRTVMTGVAGTPWYTNMHFTYVGGTTQAAIDAVRDFWTTLAPSIDNGVSAQVEGDCALIDDTTGHITGIDSATARIVPGTSVANALPPATQGLINVFTSSFIGGRQLRGKVFIPGLVTTVSDSAGGPTAALKTAMLGVGNTLVSASSAPGPWRVLSKRYLTSAVVTSVSTPSKFGSMRSRRD